MLRESRQPADCEGDVQHPTREEWIPLSLRRFRAFSLAFFCVLFAVALQGLDSTIRFKHGLPASNSSIVNTITYIPTLCTIVIGFSWYSVVSDIKKVTPWSNMTSRWASSAGSVSLDYVTSLEILSLFTALRKRHWPMFLALIGGFLCGATVVLANSLVRIDLLAPSSRDAIFTRDTRFNFEDALVEPVSDGYQFAFPTDYSGSRPYAAVQSSQDSPNDNPIPWTSGGYAFESFRDESTTYPNSTISATVQSFAPNMNCIAWSVTSTTDGGLVADFPGDICEGTFREGDWAEATIIDGASGWLNIATCNTTSGQTKDWITARLVYDKDDSSFRDPYQNQWLICDPHFTVQDAEVTVNKTTGEIISFSPSLPTVENVQLGIPTAFLFILLRNPFAPSNQWTSSLDHPMTEQEMKDHIRYNRHSDSDSFFVSFANADTLSSAAPRYMNDSELFRTDVEALGNSIFAQLINFFAREPVSEELTGSIGTTEARLFLRAPFLHTLQAAVVLIGVIAIVLATILRPKTLLEEDPGSMSAAATMMANSSISVSETFGGLSTCSEREMRSSLSPCKWRMTAIAKGSAGLESSKTSADVDPGKNGRPTASTRQNPGWNPVALSLWARLSVSLLMVGMIIALALILKRSRAQDGVYDNTSSAYVLFTVLPTVALLLLGYACSGTDSAVRALAVFRGLRNGSNTSMNQLHVNVRDSPFFWLHRHGLRPKHSWALVLSALCYFMIPGIKLVAAGLYSVELFLTTMHMTNALQVDASLSAHFSNNISMAGYSATLYSERVSMLAEWDMIEDWRLRERFGSLGNLVLANLTDVLSENHLGTLRSAEVVAHVPAMEVKVNCSPIEVDMIGIYENGRWKYKLQCSTADCERAGVPMIYNNSLYLDDSDNAGFNETGYWEDGSHTYFGIFGTPYKRLNDQGTVSYQHELWQVHFIDFSNTLWPLVNKTPVALNSENKTLVTPESFGSRLPQITSAKCQLTLNTLTVKTTFTSSLSPTDTVQWTPTSFDNTTITNRTAVDPFAQDALGSWLQPQVVTGGSTSTLRSSTYFPTFSRATNFFELLGVYANNTLHNMSAYDSNPAAFLAACEAVSTAYTVQALLEMRPWARAAAAPRRMSYYSDAEYETVLATVPNDSMRNISGIITYSRERVVQDATSTYVLMGLLSFMLVCLGLVFILLPFGPVLPRSPGSIATRMSLVAGSQLVRRLRQDRVQRNISLMDDAPKSKTAHMGWWAAEHGTAFRWGVDIGEGCLDGSWNNEPQGPKPSSEPLLQEQTPRDSSR